MKTTMIASFMKSWYQESRKDRSFMKSWHQESRKDCILYGILILRKQKIFVLNVFLMHRKRRLYESKQKTNCTKGVWLFWKAKTTYIRRQIKMFAKRKLYSVLNHLLHFSNLKEVFSQIYNDMHIKWNEKKGESSIELPPFDLFSNELYEINIILNYSASTSFGIMLTTISFSWDNRSLANTFTSFAVKAFKVSRYSVWLSSL